MFQLLHVDVEGIYLIHVAVKMSVLATAGST